MKTVVILILSIISLSALSQCINCETKPGLTEFCWGQDPDSAKVVLAYFTDAWYSKSYQRNDNGINEQLERINWLLDNIPCLNIALYNNYLEKFMSELIEYDSRRKANKYYRQQLTRIMKTKEKYFYKG